MSKRARSEINYADYEDFPEEENARSSGRRSSRATVPKSYAEPTFQDPEKHGPKGTLQQEKAKIDAKVARKAKAAEDKVARQGRRGGGRGRSKAPKDVEDDEDLDDGEEEAFHGFNPEVGFPADFVPRGGLGRRAKGNKEIAEASGAKIDDVFAYDFVSNLKDKFASDAARILREGMMASQAQMIKLVAGWRERGVRSIVLTRYGEVVAVCIYRCVRGPKSVFLEIASFSVDSRKRREGNGGLLSAAVKHLAWKHGAKDMLVHTRTTQEAKGFWTAMGFKAASRFTAQLVDVDGGDWGWPDTILMEHPVEHMAHISDTLLKMYRRPAPYASNLNPAKDGMVVWARVRKVWHPAKILLADGDTASVVLLALNEVHAGVPVEDLRPYTTYNDELMPREGEEDLELVNMGIDKAKSLIEESPETADPVIAIDARYIPGLVGTDEATQGDMPSEDLLTDEDEILLQRFKAAAAAYREDGDAKEAERQSKLVVELSRECAGTLGLTLKSLHVDKDAVPGGAIISDVTNPDSLPKNIRKGLLVVEVMGQDVRGKSFAETVQKIQTGGRPVQLKFEPRVIVIVDEMVTRNKSSRRASSLDEDVDDDGEDAGLDDDVAMGSMDAEGFVVDDDEVV